MWSLLLAFMHSIVLCLNGGSPSPVILALQRGEQVVPIDTLSRITWVVSDFWGFSA